MVRYVQNPADDGPDLAPAAAPHAHRRHSVLKNSVLKNSVLTNSVLTN